MGKMKSFFRRPMRLDQLALFTEQLGLLTSSGLTVIVALQILRKQFDHLPLRSAIDAMIDGLYSGERLHEILHLFPHIFDQSYVAMVRVGEMSGQLGEMLLRHGKVLARICQVRGRMMTILTYPLLVLVGLFIVILFMGKKIIPQFQTFALDGRATGSQPFLTTAIVQLADHTLLFLTLFLLLPVLCFRLLRKNSPGCRRFLAHLSLRVPLVGPALARQDLAIFAQNLSVLLSSGVPLSEAFEAAQASLRNEIFREKMEKIFERVSGGESFGDLCQLEDQIDPIFSSFVAIGESTGKLADMAGRAGRILMAMVEVRVDRLVSLLEPLSVIILAALVGLIAVGIFLPLVQMLQLATF